MEILEKGNNGWWTEKEKLLFDEAVKKHGVDKDQIHKMVTARTFKQIQGRLKSIRSNHVIVDPSVSIIIKNQARK